MPPWCAAASSGASLLFRFPCRYPVPPRPETSTATEKILGRWLKARGNRDKVTRVLLQGAPPLWCCGGAWGFPWGRRRQPVASMVQAHSHAPGGRQA